jgi:hypothetical protein
MDNQTSEQDKQVKQLDYNRNPNGNGGFKDNPENINVGGRPKNQESFTYWMNFFKNLTLDEFAKWQLDNPKNKRTVAANLAIQRMVNAQDNLKEFREVADRTEGRPRQPIGIEGDLITRVKVNIKK